MIKQLIRKILKEEESWIKEVALKAVKEKERKKFIDNLKDGDKILVDGLPYKLKVEFRHPGVCCFTARYHDHEIYLGDWEYDLLKNEKIQPPKA